MKYIDRIKDGIEKNLPCGAYSWVTRLRLILVPAVRLTANHLLCKGCHNISCFINSFQGTNLKHSRTILAFL